MLDTRLGPRQAITACLTQWRQAIVTCDNAGLPDQIREIETVSRMRHAVMLEAVAELEGRNLAATTGFGSTKRLLTGMLQLPATEAGTRVTPATHLSARCTLNGEVLPPVLPNTAAALAAGQIRLGQVRVIAETMGAIPSWVGGEQRAAAEADLARYAPSFTPTSLHKIGRHLLAHLDQDGPPTPRRTRTRPGRRRAPVGGTPRRTARARRIPRTRAQCHLPLPDRTARRTPPGH